MKSENLLKTCPRCGTLGDSLVLFGRNAASADGRACYCKPCNRELSRSRQQQRQGYQERYREENRERLSELAAAKYKASAAHKEAVMRQSTRKVAAQEERTRDLAAKESFDNVWSKLANLRGAIKRGRRRTERSWIRRELDYVRPSWSPWDDFRGVYEKAKAMTDTTGVMHEVDHIYPIRSDWVCGLHTPTNLQVLDIRQNAKKGNRPWGPAGDELWDPGSPETYWPGEQTTVTQKIAALDVMPYVDAHPEVAAILVDFYELTGEPEGIRLGRLRSIAGTANVPGAALSRLLTRTKTRLAPEALRTKSGNYKSSVRPARNRAHQAKVSQ